MEAINVLLCTNTDKLSESAEHKLLDDTIEFVSKYVDHSKKPIKIYEIQELFKYPNIILKDDFHINCIVNEKDWQEMSLQFSYKLLYEAIIKKYNPTVVDYCNNNEEYIPKALTNLSDHTRSEFTNLLIENNYKFNLLELRELLENGFISKNDYNRIKDNRLA